MCFVRYIIELLDVRGVMILSIKINDCVFMDRFEFFQQDGMQKFSTVCSKFRMVFDLWKQKFRQGFSWVGDSIYLKIFDARGDFFKEIILVP